MRNISLLIADDQPLIRHGLRALLTQTDGIEVVGDSPHGRDAVRKVRLVKPDVVLMDVDMPHMNGVDATREICRSADVVTRVVILTIFDDDEFLFESLRAGASGFVLKESPTEDVVNAIRAAVSGEALLSPKATRRLIQEFARRPALSPSDHGETLTRLTGRERDVFDLLVEGYNNGEIAKILVLGESTVKSHVQHLYQKLGVRDRVQLVIQAYENGIVGTAGPPTVG